MNIWLWSALLAQIAMGAFDTLYHHEGTERLAWRPSQAGELRLHGIRNIAYAVMFMVIGWTKVHGLFAWALIGLMIGELGLTLWDFVEEDRTRKLPATERITHTLLTLNYGIVLAMLLPVLARWADSSTALNIDDHGVWSWVFAVASGGVLLFGVRDLAAAQRASRLEPAPAALLADVLDTPHAILVTGGTGFIGKRLVSALATAGHTLTVLTRDARLAADLALPLRIVTSLDQISDTTHFDAIINLAGEPISDAPWRLRKRRRILRSRLAVTRQIVALIARLKIKPNVLISGSAIGWYGVRGDERLDETATGTPCFSRHICVAWEAEARKAEASGVRTVLLRTGLVLGTEGGMLARLLTPFEFGLGGRFGSGRHWMSWIHRDDLVRLIVHCVASPAINGAVNATAPEPVTNSNFTRALGHALSRPALIPIPGWPLVWLLGDFARELLLGGQRVIPTVALRSGFVFRYPDIDSALTMLGSRTRRSMPPVRRVRDPYTPVCDQACHVGRL